MLSRNGNKQFVPSADISRMLGLGKEFEEYPKWVESLDDPNKKLLIKSMDEEIEYYNSQTPEGRQLIADKEAIEAKVKREEGLKKLKLEEVKNKALLDSKDRLEAIRAKAKLGKISTEKAKLEAEADEDDFDSLVGDVAPTKKSKGKK